MKRAPTELLIFSLGPVETLKGDLRYTPRSAALIEQQWLEMARELGFDWGHTEPDPSVKGAAKKAAGWGSVKIKGDLSCWIVGIRWNPDAERDIINLAFRYLSPWLVSDPATGEILRLNNVALSNNPATLNAKPIME